MTQVDGKQLSKNFSEKYGFSYNHLYFTPIRPKYTDGELEFYSFCYTARKFDGEYKSFQVVVSDLENYKKFLRTGELEDAIIDVKNYLK